MVAVCYATGPLILSRWLSHLPGLGVITASLALTALVYLPVGLAQAPSSWPGADVVLRRRRARGACAPRWRSWSSSR